MRGDAIKPLLLDRRGECLAPEGYQTITNEVDWLVVALTIAQGIPDSAPALLVRGESLCRWAGAWWRQRGWPCEERYSPVDTILQACPALSRDEAKAILDDLGDVFPSMSQPLNLIEILENLYHDFNWSQSASRSHAALWLLWLESARIPAHHTPLLVQQAHAWRNTNSEVESLYPSTSDDAHHDLRIWLHLEQSSTPKTENWGEFPQSLPARWIDVARQEYALQVIRHGTTFWNSVRHSPVTPALLETAASATFEYLLHHHEEFTPQLGNSLIRYLSAKDAARLRRLMPPPDPGAVPHKPDEVLTWVTDQYLPYRLWQSEGESEVAGQRIAELARQFGLWFLNFYSSAMVGAGQNHLVLKRAEALRGDDESPVVLWVIADGMGFADAELLLRHITNSSSRLTLEARRPAFGYLPTITKFCKQPLRWSTTFDKVATVMANPTRREREVAGHRDASSVLKEAQPGDLIIWSPLDPDKTYHEAADTEITRAQVDGALRALAVNIVDAVLAAPDTLHVRIVLTTDHGRLLSTSTRSHPIPAGFEAHGRAAFLTDQMHNAVSPSSFDEIGVAIEGDIAYLDPERFGLPSLVAVTLDDSAFMTNAGRSVSRSGIEAFPHGGIYPEEVTVPWIEIARDTKEPTVIVRLTGRARAGQQGILHIEIVNPNSQTLVAESIQLQFGSHNTQMLPLEAPLARHESTQLTVKLELWPTGAEAKSATCWLILRRPDGRTFRRMVEVSIVSEELQSRENILDDLL